jgi:hypothetical protein
MTDEVKRQPRFRMHLPGYNTPKKFTGSVLFRDVSRIANLLSKRYTTSSSVLAEAFDK